MNEEALVTPVTFTGALLCSVGRKEFASDMEAD